MMRFRALLVLLPVAVISAVTLADESYSPYVSESHPTRVYWGDTHVHSNLSMDANSWGNKKLTPTDAYRFARGDTVQAHNGMRVRLRRPLDFLVVADHAVNMGVLAAVDAADPVLLKTELGKRISDGLLEVRAKPDVESYEVLYFVEGMGQVKDDAFRRSIWDGVINNAETHNDPGKFTTFIGYEWSSSWPIFGNLHRIVIFEDGADSVRQVLPFTKNDSRNPRDLWAYLEEYQQETGGDVLAIPHNSNLSSGHMFSMADADGNPFGQVYAATRARWEPLFEVTQMKGDSEAHPMFSPTDEFADYETWNSWLGKDVGDVVNEAGRFGDYARTVTDPEKKNYEYARPALKLGLEHQANLGVNPFKFGMIGSTDSHTSLATADEQNFWGKMSKGEPSAHRMFGTDEVIRAPWSEYTASGYAAIWAEENTRESLFTAMKRKETYATTGPRITVRFFGGWSFEADDAYKANLASIGYGIGVPMGGDLTNGPGTAPRFLIRATRDPDGANLDRVQVIKGWLDVDGELHEKIYDVALSDGRELNAEGKAPPVGNSTDIDSATYINSIGDPELSVVWLDPDFDPQELAFYYVRVIEIPTPRWTSYDARFFEIRDIPEDIVMFTQERAYTSPIWYTP